MKRRTWIIDFNAPVILGLTFASFGVWLANSLTGGAVNSFLAVRFTSWLDPWMYLRLFTHVLAHQDFPHFINNFLLILVVGPMMEEKYGGKKLLWMLCITALATGLVNVIFFKNVMLLGASGLVFMLILLSSFANIRQGRLPVTVVLVAALYIGNEVMNGLFTQDNISQLSHIVGGLCGAVFGLVFNGGSSRRRG